MTIASSRRDILLALTALGLVPASAATSAAAGVADVIGPGIAELRNAYLAVHPAEQPSRLAAKLVPGGWTPATEAALRARIASDFQAGRLFLFKGWRLSETEAQLFAAFAG